MILEDNTITITRPAIKHYGALGAVIIQELYNHYQTDVVKKDVPQWREDCLGYLPEATIKRVMTTLVNDGKVTKDDDNVYLFDGTKKKKEKKEKKPRKEQPHWEIAVKLVEWCEDDPTLVTPTKYIRLASRLHKQAYTIEYLEKRYGPDGDWYKYEFKGKKGTRPNQGDITRTIRTEWKEEEPEKATKEIKTAWSN